MSIYLGLRRSSPTNNFILIPSSILNFMRNPDLKYYFIPILNMSLNFIQSWPEFILSYPQYFNFIHLFPPKINLILYPETASAPQHHGRPAFQKHHPSHEIFGEWHMINICLGDVW